MLNCLAATTETARLIRDGEMGRGREYGVGAEEGDYTYRYAVTTGQTESMIPAALIVWRAAKRAVLMFHSL